MNLANKLSNHVLGMKFMRRTKNQVDKERVEKKHREHFAPSPNLNVNEVKPTADEESHITTGHVQEIPSYSQCEKWIFGRQSFGGFNPEVEYNVKKGIWKGHHVGEAEVNSEDEEIVKQDVNSEVDVPDEEMAATYGSIIGTLAKRFKKKKDRQDAPGLQKLNSEDHAEKQKRFNAQKFKGGFKGQGKRGNNNNKNQSKRGEKRSHDREDYNRKNRGKGNSNRPNVPEKGTPANKKRKFMKPTDD